MYIVAQLEIVGWGAESEGRVMGSAFSSLKTTTVTHQAMYSWARCGWECQPMTRLFSVRRKAGKMGSAIGLLLVLLALTAQPSMAQNGSRQTDQVDLLVFAAEQQQDLVQVAWQVGQSASPWTFTIYRGQTSDFAQAEPVAAPIFSSASSSSEVIYYSLSDESSTVATHYWLVALGSDNRQQIFGPYDVQPRLALFLPLVLQAY